MQGSTAQNIATKITGTLPQKEERRRQVVVTHTFNLSAEFEASLLYRDFQDNQGC